MDACAARQWMVAIFMVVGGFCFSLFADPIYIFEHEFDLPLRDPIGPGSEMTEAVIEVPYHLIITDLDVQINITHTRVFDLQLFLQGPAEQKRICLNKYESYEFFDGEDYVGTIFDDEADQPIEQGKPPFTGRFRPESGYFLGVFNGTDAFGTWRLQIYDMWPVDTGTLNSFALIISVPETGTVTFFLLGLLFLQIFSPAQSVSPATKPGIEK